MNDRARRQSLIKRVLGESPAPSQEALVDSLAALGVRTTQATLSRDLRELGVVKTPAGYVMPSGVGPGLAISDTGSPQRAAGLASTGALQRALHGHLLRAIPGVGMVVCKTAPGHAQVVALELDRSPPEGVLGTVGGDDTIFVAVDTPERAESLADELMALAGISSVDANGVAL